MNLIIWLIVGGIIGWIASLIMRTDAQQGIFLNVIVGIIGALLGGWLLSP
ncbi:MAG: GlsB/YeaQ/YmgE family stress response membrane protein, partial [Burkholderiaceae bacterium]